MSTSPKCANSYRTVNGKTMCPPGTAGELVVTASMGMAGDACGSSTEAFATYCRGCATRPSSGFSGVYLATFVRSQLASPAADMAPVPSSCFR